MKHFIESFKSLDSKRLEAIAGTDGEYALHVFYNAGASIPVEMLANFMAIKKMDFIRVSNRDYMLIAIGRLLGAYPEEDEFVAGKDIPDFALKGEEKPKAKRKRTANKKEKGEEPKEKFMNPPEEEQPVAATTSRAEPEKELDELDIPDPLAGKKLKGRILSGGVLKDSGLSLMISSLDIKENELPSKMNKEEFALKVASEMVKSDHELDQLKKGLSKYGEAGIRIFDQIKSKDNFFWSLLNVKWLAADEDETLNK